jgi:saccharopine dehydrogenase (NADP+, L-glutamate forming)
MNERVVLVLGAGRSAGYLIEYLAMKAASLNIKVAVADQNLDWALSKIGNLPYCSAVSVSTTENQEGFEKLVANATLVISLLPAGLHLAIAKACLKYRKPMFTASYQTPEMEALQSEITDQGLLFLNECGCDPGLDHLTAVQLLDSLRETGQQILSYEGYTGGLVAPFSDDNPWHYKFSWNPRNVILAGQSGSAQFLKDGQTCHLAYPDLFRQVIEVELSEFPDLVGYYNRNSLPYASLYGIPTASTVIRGTLRHRHFCTAWYPLAVWGLNLDGCKDPEQIACLPSRETLAHRLSSDFDYHREECKTVDELWGYLGIWELIHALKDEHESNSSGECRAESCISPAKWLEKRMTERLSLNPSDRDMVLMTHFVRSINSEGRPVLHRSSMRLEGEGGERSAMAKTVGLPLAMAVELYLKGQISEIGLQRPLGRLWYGSILPALELHGIRMEHSVSKG